MFEFSIFVAYLAACAAAAATGRLFPPGAWYVQINKPSWTPPNWLFPVAWSVIYLCIAWAAMRVAMIGGGEAALGFWAAQIALNTLWSPTFFGLKVPRKGFFVIAGLLLAVMITTGHFFEIDPISGLLMLPYFIWVSYAAALNLWIWRNN